ncbi:MAG: hypothetical protein GAK45_01604 [Pseudomonas citronellolis]|nr:MAG: hypothetical protein GAK45_01604 [Pseudomonas citronellolis]
MRRREARQQATLLGRVLVEGIDAAAQQLGRAEVRQLLADVRLGASHGLADGAVHVDDVEVLVGDHHIGRDVIQRTPDPRIEVGLVGAFLQAVANLVDGFGDDRLLARQAVHLLAVVAAPVGGDHFHHFHLHADMRRHQLVDASGDARRAPAQAIHGDDFVDPASIVLAPHLRQRGVQGFYLVEFGALLAQQFLHRTQAIVEALVTRRRRGLDGAVEVAFDQRLQDRTDAVGALLRHSVCVEQAHSVFPCVSDDRVCLWKRPGAHAAASSTRAISWLVMSFSMSTRISIRSPAVARPSR